MRLCPRAVRTMVDIRATRRTAGALGALTVTGTRTTRWNRPALRTNKRLCNMHCHGWQKLTVVAGRSVRTPGVPVFRVFRQ
jgi:hypothetical protein